MDLGMSRDAVKFGRMSKKQREKVEDEDQPGHLFDFFQPAPTSPSVASPAQPAASSSEISGPEISAGLQPLDERSSGGGKLPTTIVPQTSRNVRLHKQMAEVGGAGYIYSDYSPPTQPNAYGQGYESAIYGHYAANGYSHAIATAPISYPTPAYPIPNGAVGQSNEGFPSPQVPVEDDFTTTITRAFEHNHPYAYRMVTDSVKREPDVGFLQNMDQCTAWDYFANELSPIITSIIEFAKCVEGFMQLPQETQINLLKGSVFEMAIIAVSICYVPDAQSLYLDKVTIPIHCINPNDPDEQRLVTGVHSLLHELHSMVLNNAELGLLSAAILMERSNEQHSVEKIRNSLSQLMLSKLGDAGLTVLNVIENRLKVGDF
ncbi:hypothetical protein WR25_26495 [Diploscapter pachys]|uniref:NR LBD domain-containing protein n=1 Tax=Diploscapter pachys TaxID=2018661 RepID=A0A2A2KPU3_9BILA|nr:hypothetical protein WR25_26495 [Diploscapter pachys]